VVAIRDGVPDNPPGEINVEQNWGNVVVIRHAIGLYSMMAHLSPGTLKVREGDVVQLGQVIGLCGSSGRSPIPHLHFQLQRTPDIGAATASVVFHDAVITSEDEAQVPTNHLPVQDQKVRNITWNRDVYAALALPAGQQYRFRVHTDAGEEIEDVYAEIDLLGQRSLFSPQRGARLWFENRGTIFIIYDYVGPRDSMLYALYCALSKIPLDDALQLQWSDHLNPRRLYASPLAWVMDGVSYLMPAVEQRMSFEGQRSGDRLIVRGTSPSGRWRSAVRTEAEVQLGQGIRRIRAEVDGRVVTVEAMETS